MAKCGGAAKATFLVDGDVLQIYGELNADSDPQLGVTLGSLGYTYPLSEAWALTGSFGASRRKLVEATGASNHQAFANIKAWPNSSGRS